MLSSGSLLILYLIYSSVGFPGGSVVKNASASVGDTEDASLTPGSARSSGGGNGNLLQDSCLDKLMDRETSGWLQSLELQRVRHN